MPSPRAKTAEIVTIESSQSAKADNKTGRPSRTKLGAALDDILERRMSVDKVCIEGGRIEIRIAAVDDGKKQQSHGGIQQWD